MGIIDLPLWISIAIILGFAILAGYVEGKAAPSDAAALLVSLRIVELKENEYMTPGQYATILLPGATRALNLVKLFLKVGVLSIAILTVWWLWFPAVFVRIVSTVVTERLFANWSLDHNCYWIHGDLDRRRIKFRLRGDYERVEAADNVMALVETVWEDAKESGELVPKREELMRAAGFRRTI